MNSDLVIVNSRAVLKEIAARNLPISRMDVVPNGVNINEFCPAHDWPIDKGYILFVGRLVPQKGVELLLQAFGIILHRCPESRLVIVGDGDLELYFKRISRYLGFPHLVSFMSWQTGLELVTIYQKAQMVVMPSYYEPFGIVALEAMACGRPIIASRVGGLEEIIEDGIQGYLVPSGDYLQLAQRLANLILKLDLRFQMGLAARHRAILFNWDNISNTTILLYQSLGEKTIKYNQVDSFDPILNPNVLSFLDKSYFAHSDEIKTLLSQGGNLYDS